MTTVTVRMPVDVVDSMKAIAPLKGMSGYQALLKAYVSAGLRQDEAEFLFGRRTAWRKPCAGAGSIPA